MHPSELKKDWNGGNFEAKMAKIEASFVGMNAYLTFILQTFLDTGTKQSRILYEELLETLNGTAYHRPRHHVFTLRDYPTKITHGLYTYKRGFNFRCFCLSLVRQNQGASVPVLIELTGS